MTHSELDSVLGSYRHALTAREVRSFPASRTIAPDAASEITAGRAVCQRACEPTHRRASNMSHPTHSADGLPVRHGYPTGPTTGQARVIETWRANARVQTAQEAPARHRVRHAASAALHAVWQASELYGAALAGEVDPVSGLGWTGAVTRADRERDTQLGTQWEELSPSELADAPTYGSDERGAYWQDAWGNRRDAENDGQS